jgi:diacylglycerol kinase
MGFLRNRIKAFGYAFSGLGYILRTQKNVVIYGVIMLVVILAGILLSISTLEWLLLFFAIGLVWSAEVFNTSIETVVDLVQPENHPLAKIAKDTAAAGVLVTAITASVIGVYVLVVPIFRLIITK